MPEIFLNVAGVARFTVGAAKLALLKRLYASARNKMAYRSVILNFFTNDVSTSKNLGPRKALRPPDPMSPASGKVRRLISSGVSQ